MNFALSLYRRFLQGIFWTRWHITLYPPGLGIIFTSPWEAMRVPVESFTPMITFLLAGLWHGAALTFVLFGGFIHGTASAHF